MKRLRNLAMDDDQIISDLAGNQSLHHQEELAGCEAIIVPCYNSYRAANGDPKQLTPLGVADGLKKALHYYYKHPPAAANFITQLRDSSAGETCAMCGGSNPTTLDHVLPKKKFPEFSILSLNLAPACGCNSKKGVALCGDGQNERVLHPHYDDILDQPIISADIQAPGLSPLISLKINVPETDPMYPAIKYHLENVLPKKKILNFMTRKWNKIRLKPSKLMYWEIKDMVGWSVEQAVEAEITYRNKEAGTPNNWHSMFLRGLLVPNVQNWLKNL